MITPEELEQSYIDYHDEILNHVLEVDRNELVKRILKENLVDFCDLTKSSIQVNSKSIQITWRNEIFRTTPETYQALVSSLTDLMGTL